MTGSEQPGYPLPYTLFRLSAGRRIKLRDLSLKKRSSYDVISDQQGIVHPVTSETYTGPNGVSMRPLGKTQISLVENFRGDSVVVYEIPENTALPQGLVLVHEYEDHYSLQPSEDINVDQLNKKINDFLNQCAVQYSKEQWLLIFKEGWTWSEEHQNYFRWLDDGTYEWRRNRAGESSSKPSAHKGKSSEDENSSKGKEKASTHKERTSKDEKSSKGKDKASVQKEKSSKSSKGKEKEKGN